MSSRLHVALLAAFAVLFTACTWAKIEPEAK
jgi:hypothetical protein